MDFVEDGPIIAIAIASNDDILGINVCCQWVSGIPNDDLENYFRISLGNAYRQNEQITDILKSFAIVRSTERILIITTNFNATFKDVTKLYGFSFFISTEDVNLEPQALDLLCSECNIAASFAKDCLQHGKSFSSLISIITEIGNNMITILRSHIDRLPEIYCPSTQEMHFYSAVLSSHLQTQMTTVIESSDDAEINKLFGFLAHFLLPYQLKLSSKQRRSKPIRGLYLQVIDRRKQLPYESMWQFDRPWTWVRLKDRIVLQSPDIEQQLSVAMTYRRDVILNPGGTEEEIAASKAKLKKAYATNVIEHQHETWCDIFIKEFIEVGSIRRTFVAERLMRELLEKAILLLELIDFTLNQQGSFFLKQDKATEITSMLGITDKDQMKAITNIAQLFDGRTFRRMLGGRKEVIKKIISTV